MSNVMNTEVLKNRLSRLPKLMIGLCLFGMSASIQIAAAIGTASWTALNQGIALHIPFTVGQVATAVSYIIIGIDLLCRQPIGFGSLLNATFVGIFTDFWLDVGIFTQPESYELRLLMLFASMFISSIGSVLYMSAALGCGPRDTMMVMINRKLAKLGYGTVTIIVSAVVTFAAWLLGAPIGIGTLIVFIAGGTIMNMVFKVVHFVPKDIVHENAIDTIKALMSKPGAKVEERPAQ